MGFNTIYKEVKWDGMYLCDHFQQCNLQQHKLDISILLYYKNISVKIHKETYFWKMSWELMLTG